LPDPITCGGHHVSQGELAEDSADFPEEWEKFFFYLYVHCIF